MLIELEHVFATFLEVLYVPAEMSESPKVDPATLMDLSTTHTKLVQHPKGTLMSAEMTILIGEITEMETIPTAEPINPLCLSDLIDLSNLVAQFVQFVLADPTGRSEVPLEAPLEVLLAMEVSGKESLKLWMIFLTENLPITMPLLLPNLLKIQQ